MNVGSFLVAAARSFPERPAVSLGPAPVWRYGEFVQRVARLAGGLRLSLSLAPGARVAFAMANGPDYLACLYAAWHAGLCAVPVNAKLHPREFAYILDNAGAEVCLATSDLAGPLSALVGEVARLKRVICVDDEDYAALCRAESIPLQPAFPEDPAWLFYTSGTTGKPKGATLTHRSLAAMTYRYYADVDHLTPHDCILHLAPLSHATGLYSLPHTAKASHHVVPESRGFDPEEVAAATRSLERITFFTAPTMLTRLMNAPALDSAWMESIRTVFFGGAPMYLEDLKRALGRFGPRLTQLYGQGEMPNTISYVPKHVHADRAHPRYEARIASAGMPRTGVEVRIVDGDGRDLPAGEIGEVAARSDVCMSGYWNNPQATAQSLRDGWLFTGDLGIMDEDGFVTLKDRSKDVIISGGTNIYPREVEEALLLHPGVLEVSVIGRPHRDWGEEVVAYVVARKGEQVAQAELDRICLDNIARFKRPKAYVFIESLPKNNYGKVLKTALRERSSAAGAIAD